MTVGVTGGGKKAGQSRAFLHEFLGFVVGTFCIFGRQAFKVRTCLQVGHGATPTLCLGCTPAYHHRLPSSPASLLLLLAFLAFPPPSSIYILPCHLPGITFPLPFPQPLLFFSHAFPTFYLPTIPT